MKKPVKNKTGGHTYKEEAIAGMIESKHKRKKKACCLKIGCSHTDVRMSDLSQEEVLRRATEREVSFLETEKGLDLIPCGLI